MKLLIVLITFNRLAYSKKTLKNLRDTINLPHYTVIVDNNSTDKTHRWLDSQPADLIIINPHNYYPGKACNIGWQQGLKQFPEATHLMRLDNDMEFAPDWCEKVPQYFAAFPELGQLGLDGTALDSWNPDYENYLFKSQDKTINMWPGNVGGPCIISRETWDRGARYDETPWYHDGGDKPTAQEDVKFSFLMHKMGYIYGHPSEQLAWTFATPDKWGKYKKYYKKTMEERGYDDPFSG